MNLINIFIIACYDLKKKKELNDNFIQFVKTMLLAGTAMIAMQFRIVVYNY